MTVTPGAGTTLHVADCTAPARHGPVTVDAAGVTGLSQAVYFGPGEFSRLRVSGSNASALAETFVVASPPAAYFRLDAHNGNDSVFVISDVTGDFYLGNGNDILEVAEGVTLYGDVYTGAGTNVVHHDEPGYGFIVGTVN